MNHLNFLIQELSQLKLNCYWDVRIEDSFETSIDVVDKEVVNCTASPALGAFLRVRKNGLWFYEATTDIPEIKSILQRLSESRAPQNNSVDAFAPQQQPAFLRISSEKTKFSAVDLKEKLNLCKDMVATIWSHSKVNGSSIHYRDIYKVKSFLNSLGTQFEFDFNQAGLRCSYNLKDNDSLFDDDKGFYASEFSSLLLNQKALSDAIAESEKFLHAPAVTPGKYSVLLDSEVAGVFTHESFGHKSEADFIIGNENALAEWKLGNKIASDCLSIVDFGGHENTSGYCPVDDDGTPAQKNYLIKNGYLLSRLHSLETASQLSESPTGNSRAMNFEFEPIVRMTSTYIEAGSESLDEILKRSEGALLVEGVKHGSGLSTFTIAPSRGYLIGKNGERKPVRLAVISGSVVETLKNIEAVSRDFKLHSGAIGGCGKGEQWPLPVADGGPYVLVKEMQVS